MERIYTVTGMTCNGCRAKVEAQLNQIPNVVLAQVQLEQNKAIITSKQEIPLELLQDELSEKYTITAEETLNRPKTAVLDSKSELKRLYPLLLIFTYITIAATLMHLKVWDTKAFMLDFMGLFYVVFSFFKLLDLRGFATSFGMYDPLAKRVPLYGKVYPFVEVFLGLCFLMRFEITLALVLTLCILGMTTVGVTKVLLQKKEIQCACLGTVLNLPMTTATFIENSIMLLMATAMLLGICV